MIAHSALIVAGCIFGIVAMGHLLRLIYKLEVRVGRTKIPQWVSVIGFIIPALMSIWMFISSMSV